MRAGLIILFFVIQSFAGESNAPALFKLAEVLPSGRCDIELMTIEFSERAKELSVRWQAAVATNQDWFLEQLKQAKPGQPLDHDPRLGLTKEEWAEYLREAENRHLGSTGTRVRCIFRRKGDTLSIDDGDTNSPLGKIRLNTTTGELFASVGRVGTPTWRSSEDPASPIGAYDMCSWVYEKGDLDAFDVRIVMLDIWRLKPSGKILWRFKDSEVVRKQNKQSFEVLFQHSPGNIQQAGAGNGSQPIRSVAIDPEGAFVMICGITWTFMAPTSAVLALASAALCAFGRTARQAYRLSRAGLWSGIAALFAAVLGAFATAGWESAPRVPRGDGVFILLTGIAPLLAIFTRRWSRSRMLPIESRRFAEPIAQPNGGPVTPDGNSGAAERPPSVS